MGRRGNGFGAIALGLSISLVPLVTHAQPMRPCTPSIEPGITVTLADAKTGIPLEAAIVAREGSFEEPLKRFGATASGQTIFGGVFERPGTYTVTILAAGYETAVVPNVTVEHDGCHVRTHRLNILLQPQKQL